MKSKYCVIITMIVFQLFCLFSCQNSSEKNLIGKWELTQVVNSCDKYEFKNEQFNEIIAKSIGMTYHFTENGKNLTYDPTQFPSNYEDRYEISDNELKVYRDNKFLIVYEILNVSRNNLKMQFKTTFENEKCVIIFYFNKK